MCRRTDSRRWQAQCSRHHRRAQPTTAYTTWRTWGEQAGGEPKREVAHAAAWRATRGWRRYRGGKGRGNTGARGRAVIARDPVVGGAVWRSAFRHHLPGHSDAFLGRARKAPPVYLPRSRSVRNRGVNAMLPVSPRDAQYHAVRCSRPQDAQMNILPITPTQRMKN